MTQFRLLLAIFIFSLPSYSGGDPSKFSEMRCALQSQLDTNAVMGLLSHLGVENPSHFVRKLNAIYWPEIWVEMEMQERFSRSNVSIMQKSLEVARASDALGWVNAFLIASPPMSFSKLTVKLQASMTAEQIKTVLRHMGFSEIRIEKLVDGGVIWANLWPYLESAGFRATKVDHFLTQLREAQKTTPSLAVFVDAVENYARLYLPDEL
jgi:hypothetical protein